jgi:hypothetical protein
LGYLKTFRDIKSALIAAGVNGNLNISLLENSGN